ncbi:hypothetical protein APHAL10511_003472 [Amanita phalloides]|nr:hypothetical protein APHAL10511_003472 [Amanita phalloides]
MKLRHAFVFALHASLAFAAPSSNKVTVTLDKGVFSGTTDGTVTKFLGIPYAQPPVGDLRYRLPVSHGPYNGSFDATKFGQSCTQINRKFPDVPSNISRTIVDYLNHTVYAIAEPNGEDCLTINVMSPVVPFTDTLLPVVVWFHGGAFEFSGSSLYDGSNIIKRSIALGEPILYVSMNYRLGGFGFMGGDALRQAGVGNVGLWDQRLALQWVNKYISDFGGNPDKVTIWGQGAGAFSVGSHLISNGGNTGGLFHAAFMQSGAPSPFGFMDNVHGQRYWEAVASELCPTAKDKVECMRQVPHDTLEAAINGQPNIFSWESITQSWWPRSDGIFLTNTAQELVAQNQVAPVPIVIGDVDDEATLFAFSNLNITSSTLLGSYAHSNFPFIQPQELAQLLGAHNPTPTDGSPFDTGTANADVAPEFKRESAAKGDLFNHGPRRFFIQQVYNKQPCWSYLSKRFKHTPYLGSYQGSDLPMVYDKGELQDYLINFVNNFDPNGQQLFNWPKYNIDNLALLTLYDGPDTLMNITTDNYRNVSIQTDIYLALKYPM